MPPSNPHTFGWTAHRFGRPMSACPYELNTDAGRRWRRGWLQAEKRHREHAGRMGEPPERWQEARRMVAAEYPLDPCQEISDNLEELARDDHDGEPSHDDTVPHGMTWSTARTYARLLVRPAGAPASAWKDLGLVRSATFTAIPPSGKTDMLSVVLNDARKMMTRLAVSTDTTATALAELFRCYETDPPPDAVAAGYASDRLDRALPSPSPPAAKKRQTHCPSHGVELRGGGCFRCQREQQRRQDRRRR